jgi:hypothetical protein
MLEIFEKKRNLIAIKAIRSIAKLILSQYSDILNL